MTNLDYLLLKKTTGTQETPVIKFNSNKNFKKKHEKIIKTIKLNKFWRRKKSNRSVLNRIVLIHVPNFNAATFKNIS